MSNQEGAWEEWLKELFNASNGHVDYYYSMLDEESAKANHPNLYEYYKLGVEAYDLVSESLLIYEGGDVVIWLDPDDPGDIDEDQLDAILSNTEFYHTFSTEMSSLRVLNNIDIPDSNAQKTIRRQIYIGAITCLETYLSDAFMNTVSSSRKYIRSFFHSFKDFKEQKFGMNELFAKSEQAEEIAKKTMLEVIYHNLPKVKNMYESTLSISFPNFSEIQKHIVVRHDLVHRNGKAKDGTKITFSKEDVDEVICAIESFVTEIDQRLKDKDSDDEIR